jgi:TPR repeat protein
MARNFFTNSRSKDKTPFDTASFWLCLVMFFILWIALVGAGIRIAYLMLSLNFPAYREPVLIAHGVTDSNDVEFGRMLMTGRIYRFVLPWPEAPTAVPDPPLTAVIPLSAPVDNSEAAAYRVKAEAGDVESASKLGSLYYDGKGVPINFIEALKWFQMAADHGDAYGEDKMGEMYRDGYVVTQDYGQALAFFHKAADQGLPDAHYNLAWMYYYGDGVQKDEGQALKYARMAVPGLQKAADEGDPEALGDLGDFYAYGFCFASDYRQALSLYQKAADQGDAYGQDGIGFMYEGGLGVSRDIPTAIAWYRKAAAQGLPDAQIALKQLGG